MEEEARRILSAAGEEGPAQTNIADAIAGIMDPLGGVDLTVPMALAGADGQRSKSFGEHLASFPLTSEEWDEVAPTRSKISADPSNSPLSQKRILLVIGGGIAAYKSLDLIRRLRERGAGVRCILTKGAQQFVTPLAAASLAGSRAHTDLFDREDEADIGHIRLARDADAIVVAPATANLMAKIACGHADDLASTVLLATTLPILIAPAMNVRMWLHPATQRNLATLTRDGVAVVGPNDGAMAEAEHGPGRMAEPLEIVAALERLLGAGAEARGAPARRQARARHLRADARADRSGALHRQPLLRTPGPCHRGGGGGGGRRGDARLRPGRHPGPARRRDGACRERARDARRGRERAAGRHRGVRRRRRRLAHRGRGRGEDQEGRQAPAGRSASSRTPTSSPPSRVSRAGVRRSSSALRPRPRR